MTGILSRESNSRLLNTKSGTNHYAVTVSVYLESIVKTEPRNNVYVASNLDTVETVTRHESCIGRGHTRDGVTGQIRRRKIVVGSSLC
jgi:hypothetical protein